MNGIAGCSTPSVRMSAMDIGVLVELDADTPPAGGNSAPYANGAMASSNANGMGETLDNLMVKTFLFFVFMLSDEQISLQSRRTSPPNLDCVRIGYG